MPIFLLNSTLCAHSCKTLILSDEINYWIRKWICVVPRRPGDYCVWCKKCLLIKVQQFLTTIQQQWHGPVDSVETVDRPVSQAFRASSHLHYRHWTTHTEPLIHHHGPQHWQSGHCPQHEPLCQEDGVCCAGTTCHQGFCTGAGTEGGKTRTYLLFSLNDPKKYVFL